jgi:hypothetical protein
VPAAWYHVGRAYLSGCGVPASPSTALRWLVPDADEVEAQTLLAFSPCRMLHYEWEPLRGRLD